MSGGTGVAACPAAYLRASGPSVQSLEQTFRRLPYADHGARYRYTAPGFDVTAALSHDRAGVVLEYRGIAPRSA